MQRYAQAFFAAAAVVAGLITGSASAGFEPRYVEGQYIVTVERVQARSPLLLFSLGQNLLSLVGGGEITRYYAGPGSGFTGFAVRLNSIQARMLSLMPGVSAVEQDQLVFASVTTQTAAPYNLDRIDQRALPLNQAFGYDDAPGQGAHVYIVDSGINTQHTEFTGRVGLGRNFVRSNPFQPVNMADTADCNGHGTHVAGTAVGSTYGLAKTATVHAVRTLACNGSGQLSDVIAGIDWIISQHQKPAVANFSLGGSVSTALDAAIRSLVDAGVTTVVAAGNSAASACNQSPSREPAAITVGSTNSVDDRSSFSNFGSCVDLFAPGSDIVSASNTSLTATRVLSGTSMAAPLVAGAAAVYLGRHPSALPSAVAAALIADATPNVIRAVGSGSPNRLLFLPASGPVTPIDQGPVARFNFDCVGLDCSFDATASTDDVGLSTFTWNFGDGSQAADPVASHHYADDGNFGVTLTVTDTAGQTSTTSRTLAVVNPAVDPPASGPCTGCVLYHGDIGRVRASVYLATSEGFSFAGGSLSGYLRGPANTNFDLYLERLSSGRRPRWSTAAKVTGGASSHDLHFNAAAGTYRWRVTSVKGTGAFELYAQPQ